MHILIDDLKVLEFYSYPTSVCERLVEWDEGFHTGKRGLDEDVKEYFEELLKDTEKKLNKSLYDNKIAMKVLHKPSNTILYFGYKDWNWCVGLNLSPYMTGKKTVVE